jgi:hypothetical protein
LLYVLCIRFDGVRLNAFLDVLQLPLEYANKYNDDILRYLKERSKNNPLQFSCLNNNNNNNSNMIPNDNNVSSSGIKTNQNTLVDLSTTTTDNNNNDSFDIYKFTANNSNSNKMFDSIKIIDDTIKHINSSGDNNIMNTTIYGTFISTYLHSLFNGEISLSGRKCKLLIDQYKVIVNYYYHI